MKPITTDLSHNELQVISHALGIDLFKAVISLKLKDKHLPNTFYRNYYNTSERMAKIAGIIDLIEKGFMEKIKNQSDYYSVTLKGIEQFRKQFSELVIYKSKKERDVNYLKHRINYYCAFYNYKFSNDNAQHIIEAYKDWLNDERVSHTMEDVIKYFQSELKQFIQ